MIRTPRFTLLPCEARHVEAFRRGHETLAAVLGMRVPQGWPEFPEAFAVLPSGPAQWGPYLFVDGTDAVLVGNGGFKGPPDASGLVEFGYEIAPEFRGQGFATEIVRGLVDFALADPAVQGVQAHTLGETNASNRVLEKVGLRFVSEFDDPDDGKIWCWQRWRGDAAARADRG